MDRAGSLGCKMRTRGNGLTRLTGLQCAVAQHERRGSRARQAVALHEKNSRRSIKLSPRGQSIEIEEFVAVKDRPCQRGGAELFDEPHSSFTLVGLRIAATQVDKPVRPAFRRQALAPD